MPKIPQPKITARHYRQQRPLSSSLEESTESDNAHYLSNNACMHATQLPPTFQVEFTHDEERNILWFEEAKRRASGQYALQRPQLDRLGYRGRTIYDAPRSAALSVKRRSDGSPKTPLRPKKLSSPSRPNVTPGRRRSLIDETFLQADNGKSLRTVAEAFASTKIHTILEHHKAATALSTDAPHVFSNPFRPSTPSLTWSGGLDDDSDSSADSNSFVLEDAPSPLDFQQGSTGGDPFGEPFGFSGTLCYARDLKITLQQTQDLSAELEQYNIAMDAWKWNQNCLVEQQADQLFDMFINTDNCQDDYVL